MEAMIAGVTAGAAGSSSADRPHPNSEENSPYDSRKPPPLDAKHSDASSTGVPEIREPNVAHTPPPGAFPATDPPTSQKNRFPPPQKSMYPTIRQASSFSFPSPGSPLHPQLNFSVSSPSLPYFPDSPVESTAKYRPRTRSPSDGADVRWYFCKTPLGPNEAAASVPLLEVVGKGEYFRFSVSDSSTLEAAFLEREEELVSAWWKEYGESREGPSSAVPNSSDVASREIRASPDLKIADSNRYKSSRSFETAYDDDEIVGVIVKGGLYEVDLRQRRCSPVYWRGDHRRVLRGHWFALKGGLDWLPLREDIAEQLEIAYVSQIWRRRRFQPSGLFAARVNLHGASEGLHALFTGEDDSWEAWLCIDANRVSQVLGLRGSDFRLRRGFVLPESAQPTQDEIRQRKEEEMDDYASKVPVRHVVFMVHGIGQRLQRANLVDDVGTFRHTVSMLAEQHLTQYQRNCQRVLFIPCQWRRGLKLGGESAVEDCTLEGVRALRTMLSATVHDVLYYMSPVYCQDIIDSVSHSLNRLYGKFIKRNPNYDGKVSIYGHSLGSVLSYDILCHQRNLTSLFPIIEVRPEVKADSVDGSSDGHISEGDETQVEESPKPQEEVIEVDENTGEVDHCIERANSDNGDTLSEEVPTGPEGDVEEKTPNSYTETDVSHQSAEEENPQTSGEQPADRPSENASINHDQTGALTHAQKVDALVTDFKEETEKTELEALREEVKLLREKLVALTADQAPVDELRSMPTVPVSAGGASVSLEESERHDSDGEEKRVTGDHTEQCDDVRSHASETHDSNAEMGPGDGPSEANYQKDDAGPSQLESRSSSKKTYTPFISYTKLDFQVDTFYAVGSPLGVFLSLRNIRLGIGAGQEYWNDDGVEEEMPDVRQMMNIFHPYDPVAYRIEPLVCREFVQKRPTFIPYHKGGKRLHIGMQEFGEDLSARSRAIVDSLSSVGTRMASAFSSSTAETQDDENLEVEKKEKTYGELMMERLTGGPDGRMDYMLQDATFEHQYISVISSHTAYWHDLDTALFILRHLYKDIPDEPPPVNLHPEGIDETTGLRPITEESDGCDIPDLIAPTAASKLQDDSDPDDLPLTFAGKEGIVAILDKVKIVKPDFKLYTAPDS
ncbi:phospholipase DDHD1 [Marchantia polymorpha subsp. ruderalis]|uniref:DDHD domain-containing protein n=1 Tax=Marchantia polymorpha TaxID=3197 RepID=A0A2R6W533_MARPO|nr:hypothetical protein MARPO_0151s0040 [Marchantia polymorpha]BBN19897.1 hypothetical protein Mp_8g14660 [Marchantia polymorpha subsp. ruderalis]|eukprot:PTQ28967.1 hypothetical protein MARPO_0151s0040 [Marchantia polymorpha]